MTKDFPNDSNRNLPGGDGPKLIDLLQMRERNLLQDRIELRGPMKHSEVNDVNICFPRFWHILTARVAPQRRNNLPQYISY